MIMNKGTIFPKVKLSSIIIDNVKEPEITLEFKFYNKKNLHLSTIYFSNKTYYPNSTRFDLSLNVNEKIVEVIEIFEKAFIANGHLQEVCS